ncbi:MAG: MFS transporter [Promethearchaeota archaeon]
MSETEIGREEETGDQQSYLIDKLPPKNKIAYGAANAANMSMSGIGLGGAVTFFYNIKLGLSGELIGLAWMIFAAWNAINDPLFGIIEDRTKTSAGRHIPYIRYGAPVYGVLFILIWFPLFHTELGLFFNFLLMLFLFDTIYTITGLVTYSLPAEMCVTAEARTDLMLWSTIIGAIGLLISNVLPIVLLTGDKSTSLNPLFLPTMVLLGVSCSVVLFVSSFFLKENEFTVAEEPLGFVDSIKETFKNKPFLIFLAANFAFVLGQYTLTTGILYYIDYVVQFEILPFVPVVLVGGIGVWYILKSLPKYGVKKVFIAGQLLLGGGFLLLFLVGRNLWTAVVGLIPIVIGIVGITLTGQAVFGDTIDYDEIRTGKRRETSYSGVNALVTKPAVSIAPWAFLSIIRAFGFKDPVDGVAQAQTPGAVTGILFAFTVFPAIFLLLGALLISKFPLDGPEWFQQKRELQETHQRKEREYVAKLKREGKI